MVSMNKTEVHSIELIDATPDDHNTVHVLIRD